MQSANANLTLASDNAAPSGHFYQTASLQKLVFPVTEEEFKQRYWEKTPLILHRNNPGYYGDLFTLQDFDTCLYAGSHYVKTAEVSKKPEKHQGSESATKERILADMRDGHTLILDAVQDYNPKLAQFCRLLGRENVSRFQTNIYLTPPNGQGFTAHWDNHDVFILQVQGCKHWKVEKNRRTLPARDGNMEESEREFRGEVLTFTLRQGDVLYIPRGFIHAAECGDEYSMHITLGLYPRTWDELLIATTKAIIQRDESLRLALPLGHMRMESAALMDRVRDVLVQSADPAFLSAVLEQFRDEVVQKIPIELSEAVTSAFDPRPLGLDSRLEARDSLTYILRPEGETITLKVGARSITFPDFFGEALKFCLESRNFTVGELPGELEDEERIVFVQRLIQEGLVIRR